MNAELFGFCIDTLKFEDAINKATALINSSKPSQIITINPEMFTEAEVNKEFAEILRNSEMIIPDGIGVKIALKINGIDCERIPGIDFAKKLLELSIKNNWSVAIIGAKEEVINNACENLKKEISTLNIVYTHNGYFKDNNEIYKDLSKYNPDLTLVAMGSPKQELFIYDAKKVLTKGIMVGIGGSLDVWSGNIKRAPLFFRKTGTEWLYRTITQPERLKRIFPALPLFILKAIKYKFFK
jgi:N-acetylglucosaminyldiphosphoundecaprenol N-acetyl-beta-D-mannosaminyltransferase